MKPDLELHEKYKRDDVAKAFGEEHGHGGKWMSGVVPVGSNSLALFITLNKSDYKGHHRYKDAFKSKTILQWQSQTRASPDNAWGKKHINGGPDTKPHYIFVRTEKGNPFIYCGQAEYLDHEGSKPMTVWWKLLNPLTEDLFEKFIEATDYAGGLKKPAYVKSRELDLSPPAQDLRTVVEQEESTTSPQENWEGPLPYEMDEAPWGWASPLKEFVSADPREVLDSLKEHHKRRFEGLPLGSDQIEAWKRTISLFQERLEPLLTVGGGKDVLIALEYELPGEGGRRPDLLLVTPSHHVFVVECKNTARPGIADLDQALRYKEDLEEYHSESHGRPVHPYLAPLKSDASPPRSAEEYPVSVITASKNGFNDLVEQIRQSLSGELACDPETWLMGEYAPLPHLIEAMIATFEEQDLPRVRHVRSSNVPDAIDEIQNIVTDARENRKHVLVLVTGAPGSGKTLVGIKSTILARKKQIDSLFLSGNGPLVAVLQDAFDRAGARGSAKSVLRPMYKFKQEVTRNPNTAPGHVYVFDEGQRAWDADKNKRYEGSEIELLAEVAKRRDWGVVIGLIGEGQEIYKGEEGGLETWVNEFGLLDETEASWEVVLPDPNIQKQYNSDKIRCEEKLHLEDNIRAKSAHQLHAWVEAVIEGREDDAADLSFDLQRNGYPIHVTSSRETAEEYVKKLYEDVPDSRYGWIISSAHRKGKDSEGMKASYVNSQQLKQVWGPWFNAPSEDPASCCQLERPCSEFDCQGLELDFVLLFWGDDLRRRNGSWEVRGNVRKWSDSPEKHTLNAYRILLTRGREGTVIRCRDEETREYLKRCGASVLDEK